MNLGELIKEAVLWCYELLWPFRIILEWEQGVRLRSGNTTALLTSTNGLFGSGIHVCWPIIGEILSEECNVKVIDTSWQTLDEISWSMAARVKTFDLQRLYVQCQEQEDSIENVICSAGLEWAYLLTDDEALDEDFGKAVKKTAQIRLRKWGVSLLEVKLMNRVEANAVRLLMGE